MKKYSYYIDLYRIFFTVGIAAMHFQLRYFNDGTVVFEGFYLGVEYFFVLSGYLLYSNYKGGKIENAVSYLRCRISNLFTMNALLIFAACLTLAIQSGEGRVWFKNNIVFVMKNIYDMFFLQMFLPGTQINFPLWYVSVMVWGGMILYAVCQRFADAACFQGILAGGILLLYGFISFKFVHIDVTTQTTDIFCIRYGFLRGMADMSLGILANILSENMNFKYPWFIRFSMLIYINWIIFVNPHTELDYTVAVACAILITNEFISAGNFERNTLFSKIRDISLGIYFIQTPLYYVYERFFHSFLLYRENVATIVFVILSAVVGYALVLCSQKIDKTFLISNR